MIQEDFCSVQRKNLTDMAGIKLPREKIGGNCISQKICSVVNFIAHAIPIK